VGSTGLLETFLKWQKKIPSIIFIDEIDSIGAKGIDSTTSGDREVQRTLMQLLLKWMDFNPRGNVGS